MIAKYGQHDTTFIADTVDDLKNIPVVSMGSTCYIIETSDKYMVNSSGEWVLQTEAVESGPVVMPDGTTIDLSAYATIQYSDAQDSVLKTYIDTQDAALLASTDAHIAEAVTKEGTTLKTNLENLITTTVSGMDVDNSWGEW